jgi:SAM-dependent methyltransferase
VAIDPEDQLRRRSLFGTDAVGYREGRPGYPDRVYDLLRDRCGLSSGARVIEVGPGTGQATERLLDAGATVTAVELSEDLAMELEVHLDSPRLSVVVAAFEDVELPPASADLIASATAFHWVPTDIGLRRCAEVLVEGGFLALWWNVYGDPNRPDPFHDALDYEELLAGHYVLATSLPDSVSAAEVLACYRSLQQVEIRFRVLKDFLHLRPIFHWTENRVRGHIAICVIAAVIEALLGKALRAADVRDPDIDDQHLSPRRALDELSKIRRVALDPGDGGPTIELVTRRSRLQQTILKALDVNTRGWNRATTS